MGTRIPHIGVCICTFKRPQLLERLLHELSRQVTEGLFEFSITVVDNDREKSAKQVVSGFAARSWIETSYWVEPVPNIAMARNRCVANATGDFLAFIDDDEFPDSSWLATMFKTCTGLGVSGVLGPVLPHYDTSPPEWLIMAGFYDRPRHPTGFPMHWQECRTGNVLISRHVIEGVQEVFRPEFGAGGEDQDFFRRNLDAGHRFVWCDEAPVYETVPPHRWKRRFLLTRALLRGKTTFRHPGNRVRNITKSAVALPVYAAVLPFLIIGRHHLFMKCLVRLCDHAGRLLAMANLNPISERNN